MNTMSIFKVPARGLNTPKDARLTAKFNLTDARTIARTMTARSVPDGVYDIRIIGARPVGKDLSQSITLELAVRDRATEQYIKMWPLYIWESDGELGDTFLIDQAIVADLIEAGGRDPEMVTDLDSLIKHLTGIECTVDLLEVFSKVDCEWQNNLLGVLFRPRRYACESESG